MKGRKKKPAEILKLQGNPGKRAIPNTPKTMVSKLPIPKWMTDPDAKKEWTRIRKAFENIEIFTEADIPILEMWCNTYAEWKRVEKKIRKEGHTILGMTGLKRNPLSVVAKDLRSDLLSLITRLGFSPVDRMKLALPVEPPENEIESFLKRKGYGKEKAK